MRASTSRYFVAPMLVVLGLSLAQSGPAHACAEAGTSVSVGCNKRKKPAGRQTAETSSATASDLLRMINASRKDAGLKSLKVDEGARSVAARHSRRMAERGETYPDPAIESDEGREEMGNPSTISAVVGRAANLETLHHDFMSNRFARDLILTREALRIGVGLASGDGLFSELVFVSKDRRDAAAAPARARRSAPPREAVAARRTIAAPPPVVPAPARAPVAPAPAPVDEPPPLPSREIAIPAGSDASAAWALIPLALPFALFGGLRRRARVPA